MDKIRNLIKNPEQSVERDNRFFFLDPPQDAPEPAKDSDPLDQNHWTEWRKSNFDFFKKHLEKEARSKSLLDIGAGPSRFREITLRFDSSVGIDFYPHEKVQVVADISKGLPFKNEVFDIAFASNVLEHMSEPKLFFKECHRVLKPEGFLIGTVPFMAKTHQEPYDFYRYTTYALEKLSREAGFLKIQLESLGKAADLYETSQRHFFKVMIGEVQSPIRRFLIGSLEKISRLINRTAKFAANPPASAKWTEGYGFIAWK